MDTFLLYPALTTHRGLRRDRNEDAVAYKYPADPRELASHGALFALADGVGGLEGGQKAADLALRLLLERYYGSREGDIETRLAAAVQEVNTRLYNEVGRGATTLVAAVLQGHTLVVAHVGDSLAYWLDAAGIQRLTEEHAIVPDPAAPWQRKLTRAIGHRASVTVDTASGPVSSGGRVLLVSDGATRYLEEQDLYSLCHSGLPDRAVAEIVQRANAGGGIDNVSAVLVVIGLPCSDTETLQKHLQGLNPYVHIPDAAVEPPAESKLEDSEHLPHPPEVSPRPRRSGGTPDFFDETDEEEAFRTPPLPYDPYAMPPPKSRGPRALYLLPLLAGILLLGLGGAALLAGGGGQQPQQTATAGVQPAATATGEAQPTATVQAPSPEPEEVPTGQPAAGMRLTFAGPARTYLQVGGGVASFSIVEGRTYEVNDLLTDSSGVTWYQLYDRENNQNGWIAGEDLPDYQILP